MNIESGNRRLVQICLFAALIAALGLLPRLDLPIAAGVPVTAQTLGVMLAGLVLGSRAGALSVLLFLFVVALGMPLLAGGRGGLGVFFGPTAGFLIGWVPGAFVTGLIGSVSSEPGSNRTIQFMRALIGSLAGGIIVVYAFGAAWLAWISGMSLNGAILATVAFIPGDLLKVFIAAALTVYFQRYQISGSRS